MVGWIAWRTYCVLCLYESSDRPQNRIAVGQIHKRVNYTYKWHARVHCVSDRCFAAARVPSEQTLFTQPHSLQLILSLRDSKLRLSGLKNVRAAEFIEYLCFATEIRCERLTIGTATNYSVATGGRYVGGRALYCSTTALKRYCRHDEFRGWAYLRV